VAATAIVLLPFPLVFLRVSQAAPLLSACQAQPEGAPSPERSTSVRIHQA
jgi:hypothetical protein